MHSSISRATFAFKFATFLTFPIERVHVSSNLDRMDSNRPSQWISDKND